LEKFPFSDDSETQGKKYIFRACRKRKKNGKRNFSEPAETEKYRNRLKKSLSLNATENISARPVLILL